MYSNQLQTIYASQEEMGGDVRRNQCFNTDEEEEEDGVREKEDDEKRRRKRESEAVKAV